MLIIVLYIIFAYLCGSIPSAYIIARLIGKVDIRTVGSGNPGATNVFRMVGKCAGIVTFISDSLKGFLPVYFVKVLMMDYPPFYSVVVAAVVVIGHVFTVFLKFKGGKGVATGLGVFLALMFWPSVIAFAVFVLIFVFSGYVSLASICAVVSLPFISYILGYPVECIIFSFVVAGLIIYNHRTNIKRLKNSSENKFEIFKRK
ncbi:MAG: glycerol-3-phosphate 1-O-acyltransferase PlsY [Endomicrobium sp.]|jgi:glycerol-3-phosphate acyltransferase PlsY|nr:glycerol-3-phosphate 1-O-acyltransferase PlsY [Endomicrobium sp.]